MARKNTHNPFDVPAAVILRESAKSTEKQLANEAFKLVVAFEKDWLPDYAPLGIVMKVGEFRHTMGDKAMIDLGAFITYSGKHGMTKQEISATVGHDLNDAGLPCFLPRSTGYAKLLEK